MAAVREALSTLIVDVDADATRSQRYREYLGVAEVEQALSTSSLTADQADAVMRRLQALQVLPSRWQLERTVNEVQEYLDGGEADDAQQAISELQDHVKTLGPRGAGWSEILALDELQSQLGQDLAGEAESAEQARQAIRSSIGALERELQNIAANSAGGRAQLRQALADWKARSEYAVTDPLAVAALQAKSQYQPVRPDQLEAARSSLTQSMQNLESFLAQGSPENADRWKKFLRWDALQRQVGAGSPRLRELARTYQRLRSGEQGLELAPFRDLRNDLRNYLERMQLFDGAPLSRANARRELRSAMDGLQRFLETGPQERQDSWNRFLRWDELESLLDQDARDIRLFARVLSRFEADEPGLELAPYRRVANHLGKHMELIATSGVTDDDRIAARLERTARDLQAYADQPTPVTLAAVRGDLQWLEATQQLPDLASRIRSRFEQPNVQFKIQSDLVVRALSDTATQTDPVAMWFYGSWVTGTSRANVNYRGRLMPSSNSALIDIVVGGAAHTVGVGRQRRVEVYTTADTNLSATKRLMFDGYQLTSMPAVARACSNQHVQGVNVNRQYGRGLIGRLALRRAAKLRPCAEECANCQARQKLTRGMDSQTAERLSKTNQQLAELRARLRAEEAFPEHLHVHSTNQEICMQATLRASGIFTAPGVPPEFNLDHDVVVQLHESAANNLMATRIAGMKIDNERIEQQMQELNIDIPPPETAGDLPEGEEEEEDEDEPWSMQFDEVAPVSMDFRDGRVKITVRGTNFTRRDQKIDNTIDIVATYEFVFSEDRGLGVRRLGDVEITFVGTEGRLSTRQITYKTFLARKVRPLFRERISMEDVPAGDLKDQLEQLPPSAIFARNGWITIGTDVDDATLKEAMGS